MEEKNINNQEQELDLNQLMKIRREKLVKLQADGKDPFEIIKFDRTHNSKQIKDNFEELEGKDVTIAGRIMAKRIMGKASFCHIQDNEGNGTLNRSKKKSFYWYKKVIATNGEEL